jgi:hypothetical protein
MRAIPLFCNDLEPIYRLFIPDDIVQEGGPVFFNPKQKRLEGEFMLPKNSRRYQDTLTMEVRTQHPTPRHSNSLLPSFVVAVTGQTWTTRPPPKVRSPQHFATYTLPITLRNKTLETRLCNYARVLSFTNLFFVLGFNDNIFGQWLNMPQGHHNQMHNSKVISYFLYTVKQLRIYGTILIVHNVAGLRVVLRHCSKAQPIPFEQCRATGPNSPQTRLLLARNLQRNEEDANHLVCLLCFSRRRCNSFVRRSPLLIRTAMGSCLRKT